MYFIGQGKDIHRIKTSKNTKCVLGGFEFNSNYKIIAHSDGDLVLHAIANAILGACQAGDIGIVFPDNSSKYKGLDSKEILAYALTLAKNKKLSICNLDMTIISDKIMINPIRKYIHDSLVKLLRTKKVNVKATRFEQNKNIIACETIILMEGR